MTEQVGSPSGVTQRSSPAAKIALFRSLFRGREDVYARRFESLRTGSSGYSPACANEWVRGVCEKPRVKCAACPNRRLRAVTDDLIRQHLSGVDHEGRTCVVGLYPMLLDETCYLLAIDFDRQDWLADVSATRETCRQLALPVVIERSRSGRGAHLWFFFDAALQATLARELGAHILTETMERRPDVGLHSYDRLCPNQDTLPTGGFGNLIALPLQKQARQQGNSVFLDDQMTPYADPWAFLAGVKRIEAERVEAIVRDAKAVGRVIAVRRVAEEEDAAEPWSEPPSRRRHERPIEHGLPRTLELILGNAIHIPREGMPPALRDRLLRLAAFQNPEFFKAQRMRLPTYGKPRVISCAESSPDHLALPRGCLDDVVALLSRLKIRRHIRDERCTGLPLHATFRGTLRPEQRPVVRALEEHDTGVLSATTAFGKTVIAAWLIARRGVNTLILVHREQLMDQWIERLSSFLEIPTHEIGRIGGGCRKPTGALDVALIQSLVRKGVVHDLVGDYGHLVVDECHRLPAPSFEQVARRTKARYVLGLSATVTRKDGHHPIIFMQCGPIRHRVSARSQAAARPFRHCVVVRPTAFQHGDTPDADARIEFQNLYSALTLDAQRNQLICDDVAHALREGRKPIVITERKEHLELLKASLAPRVRHLIALQGGMGRKQLGDARARLAQVPEDEARVLLATGRYLGEGFDDARLDTLFLTLPVSWRGTIAQYVGRLHRLHDRKREVRVYDYADLQIPMLARMFNRRCKGYEAVGYAIQLPASALPGWPADVPLPVDPEWKRDHAASVQRLIRDGVDAHLGNLFVHAARRVHPEAEGLERARSASEAFLFARLETLPETSGRFGLNVELPIPFNGRGSMEVDLLCVEAGLVVEIDGAQHLGDRDAYRSDRRKDALLQERGYFVVRILAEDVGQALDHVLDQILRVLAHQRRTHAAAPRTPCREP